MIKSQLNIVALDKGKVYIELLVVGHTGSSSTHYKEYV